MSFDYLRSARADWIRRVMDLRVPPRLHAALLALATAAALAGSVWVVEGCRLAGARRMEAAYSVRFTESERAVRRSNVYYARVNALVALDARVQNIVDSGNRDARRLAEIANNLPPHAWLASIARDDRGVTLEGRARDLRVLGGVLSAFARGRRVRNASLVNAHEVLDRGGAPVVNYTVHADAAPQ